MNDKSKANKENSSNIDKKSTQQKEEILEEDNIKIIPINSKNEQEAQEKIKLSLEKNKIIFSGFCAEFETYRSNYKEKKVIDEEKFKELSHKFNKTMDTFLEEITDLPESNDIGKLLLEMLTYMQLAQAKNTRIHIRLHRNKMEQAEKIALTENKKVKNNLRNIYTGFVSVIAVFLGIFTLISVNINFFGNIVKKESSIKEIIYLFVLVNIMTIISLITLIGLIYITICLFNDKKINYKWLGILIVPFILLILIV